MVRNYKFTESFLSLDHKKKKIENKKLQIFLNRAEKNWNLFYFLVSVPYNQLSPLTHTHTHNNAHKDTLIHRMISNLMIIKCYWQWECLWCLCISCVPYFKCDYFPSSIGQKKTIYVKVDEKNYTELTHARLSVCTIACTYVYAKSNAFKTIICRTKTEDLRKRNENRKWSVCKNVTCPKFTLACC